MNGIINDVSHNKIVMAFIFAVIIETFVKGKHPKQQ